MARSLWGLQLIARGCDGAGARRATEIQPPDAPLPADTLRLAVLLCGAGESAPTTSGSVHSGRRPRLTAEPAHTSLPLMRTPDAPRLLPLRRWLDHDQRRLPPVPRVHHVAGNLAADWVGAAPGPPHVGEPPRQAPRHALLHALHAGPAAGAPRAASPTPTPGACLESRPMTQTAHRLLLMDGQGEGATTRCPQTDRNAVTRAARCPARRAAAGRCL
jgi:hypothetical protein